MRTRLSAFGTAVAVFVLDRLTKLLIQRQVSAWDTYAVIPGFFNIVHTKNRGAAFGLLSEASSDWRSLLLIGLSLVVTVFVSILLWQAARGGVIGTPLLRLALALVLGGAAGNLYDRILYGSVTDFLEFYVGQFVWPAFNIADSAITIGAGLLLLDMWLGRRRAANT